MKRPNSSIFAHGKLLLAGEYFVLDGAQSLAIPTRLGQHFDFSNNPSLPPSLHWCSYDHKDQLWFETTFSSKQFHLTFSTNDAFSNRLRQILIAAQELGGHFPKGQIAVQSKLDFPRNWGLGSSSTLIYAVAKWLTVNPFDLLQKTFGGSGYDIACANSKTAIFYTIDDSHPIWNPVLFDPPFRENIHFVYLGQKQNSREGIKAYRKNGPPPQELIQEISYLAKALTHQDTIEAFMQIIEKLEQLTGNWIKQTPVKEALFPDFEGAIKSLGAWGGDFVMVASTKDTAYQKNYFLDKGLDTFLRFDEIIL